MCDIQGLNGENLVLKCVTRKEKKNSDGPGVEPTDQSPAQLITKGLRLLGGH